MKYTEPTIASLELTEEETTKLQEANVVLHGILDILSHTPGVEPYITVGESIYAFDRTDIDESLQLLAFFASNPKLDILEE